MEDINGVGDGGAMAGFVHVGEDRQAGFLANVGENLKRGIQAQPAFARCAGSVGLVERGFVDQPDAKVFRHLGQGA